ncbi:hypothetical protein KAR91_74470 [Candidatus Pacearchaeota archaeon]|nr:hypothetical protein [Candidatus Pacearchaeota archaeon]
MLNNPTKTAKRFLNELHAEPTQDTIQVLEHLLEELESKHDPEMTEVRLAESISSFIEKLRVMENNIRSYVKEINVNLPGNKLNNLLEQRLGDNVYRD